MVDLARDGRPIGIEITEPSLVTAAAMNRVLEKLGQKPIRAADLAPFRAAGTRREAAAGWRTADAWR